MKPYFKDSSVTLYHSSAMQIACEMEPESIDCIITSPPYWRQRNYLDNPGQWGNEDTVGQYVDHLVYLFSALMPALKPEGTVWLNIGDKRIEGQLCGIPWRVALDLQADGWVLRSAIVWHKPNGLPESVTDRVSQNYEMLFMLTKDRHHFFDLDPIRKQYDGDRAPSSRARSGHTNKSNSATGSWSGDHSGRDPGSVWSIPTQPFSGHHEAVMPLDLARMCVQAGCRRGGIVFDPFSGSGTTGKAAVELGRSYVGSDINAEYLELSLKTRLETGVLDLGGM